MQSFLIKSFVVVFSCLKEDQWAIFKTVGHTIAPQSVNSKKIVTYLPPIPVFVVSCAHERTLIVL